MNPLDSPGGPRRLLRLRDRLLVKLGPIHGRALVQEGVRDELCHIVGSFMDISKETILEDLSAWPTPDRPFDRAALEYLSFWWASEPPGLSRSYRLSFRRLPPNLPPRWIHAEIRDSRPSAKKHHKDGSKMVDLLFLGFNEDYTGRLFWYPFSYAFLSMMARELGFNRWAIRKWQGFASELVLFWLELCVGTDQNGQPVLKHYRASTTHRAYNRRITMGRAEPCPRNYPWPCFACPIGLDSCPSATHLETWPERICMHDQGSAERTLGWPAGIPHRGWFDPCYATSTDVPCLECRYQTRVQRFITLVRGSKASVVLYDEFADSDAGRRGERSDSVVQPGEGCPPPVSEHVTGGL